MRDLRDAIHGLDDGFLIDCFHAAAEQSPDDEYIRILLNEIIDRRLPIGQVLVLGETH